MNNNKIKLACFLCILFAFTSVANAVINDVCFIYDSNEYCKPISTGVEYYPGFGSYCSSGHVTQTSGDEYDHVHVTSTFPLSWDGISIDEDMVEDYWNSRYAGYYNLGGVDLTVNCFGYALGVDTWIQDPGPILIDDYSPTNTFTATVAHLEDDVHAVCIDSYWSCPEDLDDMTCTSEKYRESGIYECWIYTEEWEGWLEYLLDNAIFYEPD